MVHMTALAEADEIIGGGQAGILHRVAMGGTHIRDIPPTLWILRQHSMPDATLLTGPIGPPFAGIGEVLPVRRIEFRNMHALPLSAEAVAVVELPGQAHKATERRPPEQGNSRVLVAAGEEERRPGQNQGARLVRFQSCHECGEQMEEAGKP